jgi:rhodanese-related sulfurtransferase
MMAKSFMKNDLPTVRPNDVREMKDVILIDVRMPEEYVGELGHIEGAHLMTLGPELNRFLASADKRSPIIFVCRSGARSGRATAEALAAGFESSYNMDGGMLAWNKLSLPIIKT